MSAEPKLRIFFASAADVLVAGEGNGEGIIATALIDGLIARGHEVTACVGVDRFGERPGLTIHALDRPQDRQAAQPVLRARRARQAFEQSGGPASFDVVHALFPNWAPGIDAGTYKPVPFVLGPIMPDWQGRRHWWPLGFTLRRAMAPWLLRQRRRTLASAAALVTVGPWVRPHGRGAGSKIVDIPFGVNTADFPSFPLSSSGFVVLYVGRYDEARGVLDLALAAQAVAPEISDLKAIFVGDGPVRGQLEAIARDASTAGCIEVRGRVPHDEVSRLMRESSVFCMPSWGEPFGLAVVEAMSCGRPVIAADAGALSWLVADGAGGRLVPPRQPNALADAIRELAGDRPGLARMGAFNRRQVEEQFDLDVLVRRWEAVYRDAIGRRS